jgi:hypothetical protein
MSIFKDSFKQEIRDQLKTRQEAIYNRTPKDIQYYNARNSWIRMTSSVDVNGDKGALASKNILQGGTLNNGKLRSGIGSANEAYSTRTPGGTADNRLGIRLMPGITSIDVKSKSAYGSLREVVVNFNCWDIRQLEDLELLYMRPGYTVLVEWGWLPYLDNKGSLKNNIDFTQNDIINKTPTKEDLFKSIYDTAVDDYNGNYDAMFGYVKNYSWSARADGGYDCTTTIISVGEVLESLKVNYSPFNNLDTISQTGLIVPKVTDMSISDLPDLKKIYSKNILAGLFYELYEIGQKKMKISDEGDNLTIIDKVNGQLSYYDLFGKLLNIVGGDGDASGTGKIGASDEQIYITLEGLCNVINNYVTFKDSNSNKSYVKCSVLERNYLKPLAPAPLTGDGYLLCLAHPLQLSVDPTVCVINSPVWANGFTVNPNTIIPAASTESNLITFPNSKLTDADLDEVLNQLYYVSIAPSKINNKQAIVDYLKNKTQGDSETIKALTARHYQKLKDPNYKVTTPADTSLATSAKLEGVDNTKLGKSLPSSGVGSAVSLNTFLTLNFLTNLGTAQVSEAFGANVELTKSDPVAAQQAELNKEKKAIESAQTSEITNIQYVKNITRPYFYQANWETELGIIGNIYVNLNFLYRLALDNNLESLDTKEKKDINLYNFLKSVLSEISSATGNVNNFDLFVDPIDSNIYIIDVNYVDSRKRSEAYENMFELELHNTKSTVRSYKLESSIFPDQSSIVAIGAQVGGGAMATDNNTMLDFNKGLIDRIIPKKLDPTTDPNQPDVEKIKSQAQSVSTALKSLYEFFGDQSYGWITDGKFDTEKAGDYKNSLKDLINFFKNLTKSNIKNRAIIPTKLSTTMDGIGGLVIGHMFRIPDDLLPRGYKGDGTNPGSKLGYIITGIGHSIQNNDWTTNIDAQTIILDEPGPAESLSFKELIDINPSTNKITTKTDSAIKKSTSSRRSQGGTQVPNSILLHHTVGYGGAQETVDYLPTKGLSIHYAVGADGKVVQGVDEKKVAYHGNAKNPNSIGIEICTIGGLTLKNGKYIDGYGKIFTPSPSKPVIDLGYSFNYYRYYADLTDIQASALLALLKGIKQRNPGIILNYTNSIESIYKNIFGLPGIPQLGKSYVSAKPNGGAGTDGNDPGIFVHALAKGGTHTDTFPSPKMLTILKSLI